MTSERIPMTTINTMQDFTRLLREHPEWRDELRRELLTDELLELPQMLARFIEAANRRFSNIEEDVAQIRADMGDMGEVKGGHARTAAIRRAYSIARSVGLSEPRILTDEDIWNITDAADTSDIAGNDLASFRLADLIIEGQNDEGMICHVAMEISYTLAGNDTRRAIRNAQYLRDFTQNPAYAVVAGMRTNNRAQNDIDSGKASGFRLRTRALAAE